MKTARFMQALGIVLIANATHWSLAQGILKTHYCAVGKNACNSACRSITGKCTMGGTQYDFAYVQDQFVDGERCTEGSNHSCIMIYDDVTRCERKFYTGASCATQVCGADVGDYIERCQEDP